MQVENWLEDSAARLPNKVSLICDGQRLTYSEIEATANRLAHALLGAGISRGDRVAMFLENSPELVYGVFGALKAGAVFVPLSPGLKTAKLTYTLNDCRAKALVTTTAKLRESLDLSLLPHVSTLVIAGATCVDATNLGGRNVINLSELQRGTPSAPPPKTCIDIDLAALLYTSGSTGAPKGVMLTHLNIVSAATSITTYLANTSDDIVLNVLPLSFDYGLYQVLMMFKVGGTVVLERSFAFPYAVAEEIAREKVTGFPVVPTIAAMLLQLKLEQFDFSHLRYITNTAAALPISHIEKLRRAFPTVQIFSMYGLTECKRASYLPPELIDAKPGSVGRGMPNEEVYLIDEQGRRLPHGSVGELVVRGSNVMKGYWERPEESVQVLKPGAIPGEFVLNSGDIFRSDEEGYLYFLGRKDDLIKTRGEKVSPREIEDVIHKLDGVLHAAVVGVPDEILGSAIKAVVALRTGCSLTAQDIIAHCAAHLESFMIPKIIEFRTDMPQTSTGKIAKRQLAGGTQ